MTPLYIGCMYIEQEVEKCLVNLSEFLWLPWNLENLEFCSFLFKVGNTWNFVLKEGKPGIGLDSLKFNKIGQNLQFCIFKIAYNSKFLAGILSG